VTRCVFAKRKREADEFYATVIPANLSGDARQCDAAGVRRPVVVQGNSITTLSKTGWREIPLSPRRCQSKKTAATRMGHLYNADVISMPDKWEYPWYAAWDLAFHCVPLALVDHRFAKEQLPLMVREWYMHPNGQLRPYEWALGDVKSAGHAWAALACLQDREEASGEW